MKHELQVAFSSCPNDTFIFHAMIHNLIECGDFVFIPHIDDVESLNREAFAGAFPVTKLSFHAYLLLKKRYAILDSGAAIGFGCGPLLVARSQDIPLREARIAIPGVYTTAYLLLRLWCPDVHNVEVARFDQILPGIESGKYDAGLIIHEGRFVYNRYQCEKIVDLGEWWEAETRLPIPLGCIAIRRDQPDFRYKEEIESIIRNSVVYAVANRDSSRTFIRSHAQDLDDRVIDRHINLYVNDLSISLGGIGRQAIERLEEMAECKRLLRPE